MEIVLVVFNVPDLTGLALLFAAALLAGFIDSIAGGGGLITLPALLACGLPPFQALGTNKLQGCFGSGTALVRYAWGGLIPRRDSLPMVGFTMLGAIIGTLIVTVIPSKGLAWLVPSLLAAVFFFLLGHKSWGEAPQPARWPQLRFFAFFGVILGFYDGFLGPGTGTFWTLAFTSLLGRDLRMATAETKVTNFTSNVVSLILFGLLSWVNWFLGLAMGLFQTIGAWIGSKLVIKKSLGLIRKFVFLVVFCTLVKVLWDLFIPISH